jgi:hypothetical protein
MANASFGRTTAAALLVSASLGCSSSYMPAASPRVALVQDSGHWSYLRDGKKYSGGIFGGDLDKAVEGNPQAEEYARQYKTGTAWGVGLVLTALAGVITGLAVEIGDAQHLQPGQTTIPPTGAAIVGGSLVVDIVGALIAANAAPHMADAVNAYNDGLESQPTVTPQVPAKTDSHEF